MSQTDQHIILARNRKLGFAEYGDLEGYPVVYCHGSQSSRLEMHYDMSFAREQGLRIITVDRPGHGLSDFNPNGSILDFANDVCQLADHLGLDRFSVAGMSAGAPFALGIAYLFPERVHKAGIISGFAPYTPVGRKHLSKEVRTLLSLAKSAPFLVRLLLKIQAKQLSKNPSKALKGFLKIMSPPDQIILQNESVLTVIENMFKEAFVNGSQGVAYEISQLLVRDWQFRLQDISVPVSFWQGKEDNNVPYQWAELMQSKVQDGSLTMYPDEGPPYYIPTRRGDILRSEGGKVKCA